MTGVFKDATEQEFKNAEKAAWFSMMMERWWEKDKKLVVIGDKGNSLLIDIEATETQNKRSWGGAEDIRKWCRDELNKR